VPESLNFFTPQQGEHVRFYQNHLRGSIPQFWRRRYWQRGNGANGNAGNVGNEVEMSALGRGRRDQGTTAEGNNPRPPLITKTIYMGKSQKHKVAFVGEASLSSSAGAIKEEVNHCPICLGEYSNGEKISNLPCHVISKVI
jgi:hypothetical protein